MNTSESLSQVESTSGTGTDETFTLLDLLLVIVDNLRLLVIGPVVVGLFVFIIASIWPKTYASTAILKAEQATASLVNSASVLDPIAASFGLTKKLEVDDARLEIKKQIKVNLNVKEKLLTLTTRSETPQGAQALAKAVLAQIYLNSQPRDSEKLRLQKQLIQAQAREKEVTQTVQVLSRKFGAVGGAGTSEIALGYAQMIQVIGSIQNIQLDLERQLQGLDASALVQEATLPTKHDTPKRGLISILAVSGTGFALLLFVFIRQALRSAIEYEESAQKINALRASWRRALGM